MGRRHRATERLPGRRVRSRLSGLAFWLPAQRDKIGFALHGIWVQKSRRPLEGWHAKETQRWA